MTVATSYITQFFQYASSIIILPIILRYLDKSTLGLWYIFLSVTSLSFLFDFGFSASLSRNISFVFKGAKEIIREGSPSLSEDGRINYKLLRSLLFTSKRTYGIISILLFFLLISIGTFYVDYATRDTFIQNKTLIWIFFSFSTAFNYYYNYVNVFARGRGKINLLNQTIIISKVVYIITVYALIKFNLGLWSLVVGNFLSAFAARLVCLQGFYDKELKDNLKGVIESDPENLFPIMWHNAKRFGLASFTTFAFSQANIFLAGIFLSIGDVAELGLALQLMGIIVTCARVPFNTFYPQICSLWVTSSINRIKSIFLKCQGIGYVIWGAGFLVLILFGDTVLTWIHSKTFLPASGVLCVYSFFYLMELTHGNCSMLISSRNSVPFLNAAIYACVSSLLLMLLFLHLGWGLYSFPVAMCLANLPYNSWKWVAVAYKLLKSDNKKQ